MSPCATSIAVLLRRLTVRIASANKLFYEFVNVLGVIYNLVIAFHFTFERTSVQVSYIGQNLVEP